MDGHIETAALNDADREAIGNEFTMYVSMAVRCAAQIWQTEDDADLAMRVLTRAIYAPDHMPVLDGGEMVNQSHEIGKYVEENPLPQCDICRDEGVAINNGIAYCWKHYNVTIWNQFTQEILDKKAGLQTGDGSATAT